MPPMNAVETEEAVSARAEKGSGNHEGLESCEPPATSHPGQRHYEDRYSYAHEAV